VSLARLSPALVMLIVGAALLVEASTAGISTAEARKGGTLRMASFEDVGQLDTALGYAPIPFAISFATCAKLFNHPDEAGAAGTRVIPEVVQSHTVSLDGRTYDFELRRTYRFHTGAQVNGAELRGRVQPRRRPEDAVACDDLHTRDRRRPGGDRRHRAVHLGDPRARPLPPPGPADQGARGLPRPPHAAILLPHPSEYAGRPPRDRPTRLGPLLRRRARRHPACRARAQPVLSRRPTRQRRRGRVDVGESREACLVASEADRIDHCFPFGVPFTAYRSLAERYGINRPGRAALRQPRVEHLVSRLQPRPPRVQGTWADPAQEGDQPRHRRPELARTFGYLVGRRTDPRRPDA